LEKCIGPTKKKGPYEGQNEGKGPTKVKIKAIDHKVIFFTANIKNFLGATRALIRLCNYAEIIIAHFRLMDCYNISVHNIFKLNLKITIT
jgi:hypothetical protein